MHIIEQYNVTPIYPIPFDEMNNNIIYLTAIAYNSRACFAFVFCARRTLGYFPHISGRLSYILLHSFRDSYDHFYSNSWLFSICLFAYYSYVVLTRKPNEIRYLGCCENENEKY